MISRYDIESTDISNSKIFDKILPDVIDQEYETMINLIQEYDRLLHTYNNHNARSEQVINSMNFNYDIHKELEVKMKELVNNISIDQIDEIEELSQIINQYKQESLKKQQHNQRLGNHHSLEISSSETFDKIQAVINRISNQITVIEQYEKEGSRRIDGISIHSHHIPLLKQKFINDNTSQNPVFASSLDVVIQLLPSYIELLKSIYSLVLPAAKSIIQNFADRNTNIPQLDIFTADYVAQINGLKAYLENITVSSINTDNNTYKQIKEAAEIFKLCNHAIASMINNSSIADYNELIGYIDAISYNNEVVREADYYIHFSNLLQSLGKVQERFNENLAFSQDIDYHEYLAEQISSGYIRIGGKFPENKLKHTL